MILLNLTPFGVIIKEMITNISTRESYGGFMKETIRKIYKSIVTSEQIYGTKNKKIAELRKEYFETSQLLNLTNEQKQLINKCDAISKEIFLLLNEESFSTGFSLGMKLAIESMK